MNGNQPPAHIKPLILIIEHRKCQCGCEYLAPNPRTLMWEELVNLRNARILLPARAHSSFREIIHINTSIEACPVCFETVNGLQLEMFPEDKLPPFTFSNGKLAAYVEPEKETTPKNEFGLGYF